MPMAVPTAPPLIRNNANRELAQIDLEDEEGFKALLREQESRSETAQAEFLAPPLSDDDKKRIMQIRQSLSNAGVSDLAIEKVLEYVEGHRLEFQTEGVQAAYRKRHSAGMVETDADGGGRKPTSQQTSFMRF